MVPPEEARVTTKLAEATCQSCLKGGPLKKIVRDHFDGMSRLELLENLHSQKQQLGYIACSSTRAADEKRAELDARIEYIEARLRVVK